MLLALDAGGSSTRCLVARSDGTVLGRGLGGPGNHILSGWETARASIIDAVGQACAMAPCEATSIGCAVAGSAGVGPNGEGREVIEALLTEQLPLARVQAIGDMVAAFWGALATDFGVVVAAGTGSVCYGRNERGESRQVGGWGHIMGDEGSAYDIAVRALRAVARATDGRGPHTTLCERIAAAMEVTDFMGIAVRVYGEPMSRDAIARLAITVTAAAAAGDAVAQTILAEAGAELGLAAVTTLRALELDRIAAPVAYTGAVFGAGDAVIVPFATAIAAACPLTRIAAPEFPPTVGAFKLALRALGLPFTAATSAALLATIEGETR
ncbi:MAG: hypothetical protein HYR72_15610 [Deltaproteobacteria bacterium]|nr:hypothetical protein [Deltaproteobacteria bacterium]MBI3387397.1 hypothetical protein [Deltaproteobacteria bacterium]